MREETEGSTFIRWLILFFLVCPLQPEDNLSWIALDNHCFLPLLLLLPAWKRLLSGRVIIIAGLFFSSRSLDGGGGACDRLDDNDQEDPLFSVHYECIPTVLQRRLNYLIRALRSKKKQVWLDRVRVFHGQDDRERDGWWLTAVVLARLIPTGRRFTRVTFSFRL